MGVTLLNVPTFRNVRMLGPLCHVVLQCGLYLFGFLQFCSFLEHLQVRFHRLLVMTD